MRWQTVARVVVVLFGLGVAGAIYTRFDRKPPKPKAPPREALPPKATYVSHLSGGKQCRYEGEGEQQKEVSCIKYDKFTLFSDGHREIEKPQFNGDRAGKPFTITADRGVLNAADASNTDPNLLPEETHLFGHVVMHEEDGMELRSEEATYRESTGVMDIPGPVDFTNGRLSGSGVGAGYDRLQDTLDLRDQAVINIAPDADGLGRLNGRSRQLFLNRAIHTLNMVDAVQIDRDHETLRCNTTDMQLTDDNQGVKVMEMRGQSSIVPVGNGGSAPEMRSDDMHLEFLPDGRTIHVTQLMRGASMVLSGTGASRRTIAGDALNATLAADGQRLIALNGNGAPLRVTLPASADTPQRLIVSRELTADGNEQDGLTGAVFQEAVDFTETTPATPGKAAVTRRVRGANQLTLKLSKGDFADIDDARFRGNDVRFSNNDTAGGAQDLRYLAKKKSIELRTVGTGSKPFVQTARIRVDAPTIDVDLDKTVVGARGGVFTTTSPDPKKKASSGIFDDSKPVKGTAQSLDYSDADGAATYTGKAKLSQGDGQDLSQITADKITVNNDNGSLHATGSVLALLPLEDVDTKGQPAPSARATALDYDDAKRVLKYTGTSITDRADFTGPDGQVKALKITITLADGSREVKTMLAEQSVAARIAADETGLGDRLDYKATDGVYVVDGKPATLINKKIENGAETCTATYAEQLLYRRNDSGDTSGAVAGKAGGIGQKTETLANCQSWIIK